MKYDVYDGMDLNATPMLESGTVRSVLRNVLNIIQTRKGSVPLYRDFGIDWNFVDKPVNSVPPLFRAEVKEDIEKYEPRARVESVSFLVDQASPWIIKPKVRIEILEL